jgi:hypothetical protein
MEFDEILEPSGLDVAAHCPRCGPRATLDDKGGEIQENACGSCGSSYLHAAGARHFMSSVLGVTDDVLDGIISQPQSPGGACFSCGHKTQRVPIRGANMDLCPRCYCLRLDSATLFNLTGGRYGSRVALMPGRTVSSPGRAVSSPNAGSAPLLDVSPQRYDSKRPLVIDQPRETSTGRAVVESGNEILSGIFGLVRSVRWLLVLIVVIVGVFRFISVEYQHAPKQVPATTTPDRPAAGRGPAPPQTPLEAAVASVPLIKTRDVQLSTEDMIKEYPFAGHSMSWWSKRLTSLKTKTDDKSRELYELTKRRAQANGLDVDDDGNRDVRVQPSKDLVAQIGTRLGRHDK